MRRRPLAVSSPGGALSAPARQDARPAAGGPRAGSFVFHLSFAGNDEPNVWEPLVPCCQESVEDRILDRLDLRPVVIATFRRVLQNNRHPDGRITDGIDV